MKISVAVETGSVANPLGSYYITAVVDRWFVLLFGAGFPFGMVTVNVSGSFAFGALIESFAVTVMPSSELWALLFIGILGAFTTFLAFSADMYFVLERGEVSRALLYLFTSTFVSLVVFYVGLRLSRLILS